MYHRKRVLTVFICLPSAGLQAQVQRKGRSPPGCRHDYFPVVILANRVCYASSSSGDVGSLVKLGHKINI